MLLNRRRSRVVSHREIIIVLVELSRVQVGNRVEIKSAGLELYFFERVEHLPSSSSAALFLKDPDVLPY